MPFFDFEKVSNLPRGPCIFFIFSAPYFDVILSLSTIKYRSMRQFYPLALYLFMVSNDMNNRFNKDDNIIY